MKRLALCSLLAACGTNGPDLLPGFSPPAPTSDQRQIISPIIHDIAPGVDITLCSYIPTDEALDQTYDITQSFGIQSSLGSHHSVLYMVDHDRPIDTHECNDDDMINSRFLAAVGGGDAGVSTTIPDGIVFRVEAHRQLMIQTHWINATEKPIDGQAAYNLTVSKPTDDHVLAQLFTWTSTNISIPAGQTAQAHTECTVQRDMAFFRLGGHAHEWGTHVSMTWTSGGADNKFYDEDWAPAYTFAPPMLNTSRDTAMVVHAGDTLSIDCAYNNTTTNELIFPREMCTGFGFFFPGTAQFDCSDGDWPSGN